MSPEATMLAVSFDEVGRRLTRRGTHVADFSAAMEPGKLADIYRDAFFNVGNVGELKPFEDASSSSRIQWAPDGDEAFDDGSYVLQFDVEDFVRLVGLGAELMVITIHRHSPKSGSRRMIFTESWRIGAVPSWPTGSRARKWRSKADSSVSGGTRTRARAKY